MGHITFFGSNECSHCIRAKGALVVRGIPFREIDLVEHPERRHDMEDLSGQWSIPQIFFNDTHVGGADQLAKQLEKWDENDFMSPLEMYEDIVASQPDPSDPRLAPIAVQESTLETPIVAYPIESDRAVPSGRSVKQRPIPLPNGKSTTAFELIRTLDGILEQRDRPFKAHMYKKCFENCEGLAAIHRHFGCSSTEDTASYVRMWQQEFQLLHHVCDDHEFRADGYYYFRLQRYHLPDVLNSFCVWKAITEPQEGPVVYSSEEAMELILDLKKQLYKILHAHTDHNGMIDYIKVKDDPGFWHFEAASCELQVLDMSTLDERTRLALGLNLYNLFISYAFVKVGVGTSSLSRGAFFSNVKMNVGGAMLSFNDLENGILRANTRHPYASKAPFSKEDPRRQLSLSKLDYRIHFGLNCGAKSCPPIRFFHPATLDEELDVVTMSFLELDDVVLIKEDNHEVHLSMLLKWFQSDFCASKSDLPKTVLRFLKGEKHAKLARMVERQQRERKPIIIRYQHYDWSANASHFVPYNGNSVRANQYSARALFRFHGHFACKRSHA